MDQNGIIIEIGSDICMAQGGIITKVKSHMNVVHSAATTAQGSYIHETGWNDNYVLITT